MQLQRFLFALIAVSAIGGAPMVSAREDFIARSDQATRVTALEAFRNMKAPVLPTRITQGRGESIEIELTDAQRYILIIDVGGERVPGTIMEMLRGAPRDDVVVKKTSSAADGTALERGSRDEKQVLKILQEWRGAAVPAKQGKKGVTEAQLKLADRVIAMLKPRHQAQKPLQPTR